MTLGLKIPPVAVVLFAAVSMFSSARYWPPSEEPALARRFGAPYRRYCNEVRRWI